MAVHYHSRRGQLIPDYACQREGIQHGEPLCQVIPGAEIDRKIGEILIEAVTPVTLEVSLAVQEELQTRLQEADRLRQQQVQRARYEAEIPTINTINVRYHPQGLTSHEDRKRGQCIPEALLLPEVSYGTPPGLLGRRAEESSVAGTAAPQRDCGWPLPRHPHRAVP